MVVTLHLLPSQSSRPLSSKLWIVSTTREQSGMVGGIYNKKTRWTDDWDYSMLEPTPETKHLYCDAVRSFFSRCIDIMSSKDKDLRLGFLAKGHDLTVE